MTVRCGNVGVILTDIEGTTSPISFVKETLFPYARRRMSGFLTAHAREPNVARIISAAASAGAVDPENLEAVTARLLAWMDEDAKIGPLKEIQGLIWRDGYSAGDLHGAIFDDAVDRLRVWAGQGVTLAVYSSGSVLAQKLLFANTRFGDLTPLFFGFFDTAVGAKRDADSYRRIAGELARAPDQILFLSDITEELDAAAAAGLRVVHLVRPDEGARATTRHPVAASFLDIELSGVAAATEKSP